VARQRDPHPFRFFSIHIEAFDSIEGNPQCAGRFCTRLAPPPSLTFKNVRTPSDNSTVAMISQRLPLKRPSHFAFLLALNVMSAVVLMTLPGLACVLVFRQAFSPETF